MNRMFLAVIAFGCLVAGCASSSPNNSNSDAGCTQPNDAPNNTDVDASSNDAKAKCVGKQSATHSVDDNMDCSSRGPTLVGCGSDNYNFTCVDLTTNPYNCGSCGWTCPVGARCVDARCECN